MCTERLGHVGPKSSSYNSLRSGKSEGESLPHTYRIIMEVLLYFLDVKYET